MRRSLKAKLVPALPSKSKQGANQLGQTKSSLTPNNTLKAQQLNSVVTSKMKTDVDGQVAINVEDVGEVEAPEKPKALANFNPLMTCILCGGYFVDATTIVECLDTFCKSCIVKYLEDDSNPKNCPICETAINKNRPLLSLREDKLKQDIVYKLVPQAFKNEMERRRDFYATHSDAEPKSDEDAGRLTNQLNTYFRPSDKISMSLEYDLGNWQRNGLQGNSNNYGSSPVPSSTATSSQASNSKTSPPKGNLITASKSSPTATKSSPASSASTSKASTLAAETEFMGGKNNDENEDPNSNMDTPSKRYLLCPAGLSVLQLKKFIYNKFGITSQSYKVDILYAGEPMADEFTLMDVAYIYSWGRNDPMRFYYRIDERPLRRAKAVELTAKPQQTATASTAATTSTSSTSTGNTSSSSSNSGKASTSKASSNSSKSSNPVINKGNNNYRVDSLPPAPLPKKVTIVSSSAPSMKRTLSVASISEQQNSNKSIYISSSNNGTKKAKTLTSIKGGKVTTTTTAATTNSGSISRALPSAAPNSKLHSGSLTDAKFSQSLKLTAGKAVSKAADFRSKTTSSGQAKVIIVEPSSSTTKLGSPNSRMGSKSPSQPASESFKSSKSGSHHHHHHHHHHPEPVNDPWKVSTSSSKTSSSSNKTGSPLSPPAIRIKLTTSPTSSASNGSSGGKQLIGQIISPIPPEVEKELKKEKDAAKAAAAASKQHQQSSQQNQQPRYKTVTSQGVQSSERVFPATSTSFAATSSSSGSSSMTISPTTSSGQRPRGEMIHSLIDKMQSKGNLKSSCVNVTSTTPSLELITSSSTTSKLEVGTGSSPLSPSKTTSSVDGSGDLVVSTTTDNPSPRSSSGNLVLRISTKSMEVSHRSNASPNSSSHGLGSAALSPSSLDSNSSTGSKKSSKVAGSCNNNTKRSDEPQTKEPEIKTTAAANDNQKPQQKSIIFIDDDEDDSEDGGKLVMDINEDGDDGENSQQPNQLEVEQPNSSPKTLPPISVSMTSSTSNTTSTNLVSPSTGQHQQSGLQSPPPTPSPRGSSEPEVMIIVDGSSKTTSQPPKAKSPSLPKAETKTSGTSKGSNVPLDLSTTSSFSTSTKVTISSPQRLGNSAVTKVTPANLAAVLHQPKKQQQFSPNQTKQTTSFSDVLSKNPTTPITSSMEALHKATGLPMVRQVGKTIAATPPPKSAKMGGQTSASNLQLINPTSNSNINQRSNSASSNYHHLQHNNHHHGLVITSSSSSNTPNNKRTFPISTSANASNKIAKLQQDSSSAIKKAAIEGASFFPINASPPAPTRLSYPPTTFGSPGGSAGVNGAGNGTFNPYESFIAAAASRNAFSAPNLANMSQIMASMVAAGGAFLANSFNNGGGNSSSLSPPLNPSVSQQLHQQHQLHQQAHRDSLQGRTGPRSLKDTIVPKLPSNKNFGLGGNQQPPRRNGSSNLLSTPFDSRNTSNSKSLSQEDIRKLMAEFNQAKMAQVAANAKRSGSSSNSVRNTSSNINRSSSSTSSGSHHLGHHLFGHAGNLASSSSSSAATPPTNMAALAAATRGLSTPFAFNR